MSQSMLQRFWAAMMGIGMPFSAGGENLFLAIALGRASILIASAAGFRGRDVLKHPVSMLLLHEAIPFCID